MVILTPQRLVQLSLVFQLKLYRILQRQCNVISFYFICNVENGYRFFLQTLFSFKGNLLRNYDTALWLHYKSVK